MKLFASFLLLLLVGCGCGHTSPAKKEVTTHSTEAQTLPKESTINKNSVLGAWTDGSTENATFDIQQDSIFYVDQFTAYKYSLEGDSITITYPDWVFSGKVSFIKDTLVITSEDGPTKYWKFTE
jgi:biotin-(acetyl-CoA carboxylase) ligase